MSWYALYTAFVSTALVWCLWKLHAERNGRRTSFAQGLIVGMLGSEGVIYLERNVPGEVGKLRDAFHQDQRVFVDRISTVLEDPKIPRNPLLLSELIRGIGIGYFHKDYEVLKALRPDLVNRLAKALLHQDLQAAVEVKKEADRVLKELEQRGGADV